MNDMEGGEEYERDSGYYFNNRGLTLRVLRYVEDELNREVLILLYLPHQLKRTELEMITTIWC